jgi:hypothetical protein
MWKSKQWIHIPVVQCWTTLIHIKHMIIRRVSHRTTSQNSVAHYCFPFSSTNLRQMYKHISTSISTWLQVFRHELERTKHKRYTKACAVGLARIRRPLMSHSWWKKWYRVRFLSDYFGFLLSVPTGALHSFTHLSPTLLDFSNCHRR